MATDVRAIAEEMMKKESVMKRKFSTVWIEGDYAVKQVKTNEYVTLDVLKNSYKIYEGLVDKRGLVKVVDWWDDGKCVFVVMENLNGYVRVMRTDANRDWVMFKVFQIFQRLMLQGVMDYDFDITNILVKGNDIVLIDIDKLNKFKNFTEHQREWLYSRMVRLIDWYQTGRIV